MIYYVTTQQEVLEQDNYQMCSVEESLNLIDSFTNHMVQLDTETAGLDPHIDKTLLIQFGNIEETIQIVVNALEIDIRLYKGVLESAFIIGQNLKFDIKVLFVYDIIIRNCYDTMTAEQVLYMGYPNFMVGCTEKQMMTYCEYVDGVQGWEDLKKDEKKKRLYRDIPEVAEFIYEHSGVGLKALVYRYFGEEMSKEVREEFTQDLDKLEIKHIIYAAKDVQPLYRLMRMQIQRLKKWNLIQAAKVECEFIPAVAYYEWCGVHMNVPLWQQKMASDYKKMVEALEKLNQYVVDFGDSRFLKIDLQGDLFLGWDTAPK